MPENLSKTDLINHLVGARERGERPVAPDADLRGANLRWSDLRGADLRGTDLRDADLTGADLRGADLTGANLTGANLRGANPRGARILHLHGIPSGETIFIPTAAGWYLTVGYWEGNLEDFKNLIASDEGWPEARGAEVKRRRPSLQAVVALCEAHMRLHPKIIEELADKWQETDSLGLIVADWRGRAACAGDWFLMEAPAFEAEAKRLCIGCPVFWQCRAEGDRFESISPSYYLNGSALAGETGLERATRRRAKYQRRKSRAHS